MINVAIALGSTTYGNVSFGSAEDVAAAVRGAGSAFGDIGSQKLTLTFSTTDEAADGSLPVGYGSAEGRTFAVTVKTVGGTFLNGTNGATLDDIATLVESRLDEALGAYPVVVAEVTLESRFVAPQAAEEDEDEDFGDYPEDFDYDEDEAPTLVEPNASDTVIADVLTEAYEILSSVTLHDLLSQNTVDPLTYGVRVNELREAIQDAI